MTPFTGAADCRREAVFTTSPAAMPEEHEDLSGIDRDADLQVFTRHPHPVPDCKRGSHGALRIVLMSDRGSEERHHRIADELFDSPAVALELVAQVLPVRREQRPHVLGIEALRA